MRVRGEAGRAAAAARIACRALRRTASNRSGPVTWAMRRRPSREQMLDGEHRAAEIVGQQAQRVRIVGLREHVEHRQAGAGTLQTRAPVGAARQSRRCRRRACRAALRHGAPRAPGRRSRCT